jgi:hypothetical protein
MLSTEQEPTRESTKDARPSHKKTRVTALVGALAAAGLLAASAVTVQANAASAETAESLTASITGITTTLDGTTRDITEAHAEKLAKTTIADANAVVAVAKSKVDVTPLTASVASLSNYEQDRPDF